MRKIILKKNKLGKCNFSTDAATFSNIALFCSENNIPLAFEAKHILHCYLSSVLHRNSLPYIKDVESTYHKYLIAKNDKGKSHADNPLDNGHFACIDPLFDWFCDKYQCKELKALVEIGCLDIEVCKNKVAILAPYALYDFSIFSDPKKGIYAYIDNSRKYEWHQMCNRIKMINQVFINAFGKQCIVNKIYEHALSFCSAMDSSDKNAKAYLTAFFKSSRSRKISTILGSKLFLTKAILRDNNYPHKNSESQHVIESGLFSLEMAVKNSYLFIAAGHKEAEC